MSIKEDLDLWRKSKANEHLASLQERIRSGESTGDKITDYIIFCFSGDLKIEAMLRDIHSRLQGKSRQLIAFINETTDTSSRNSNNKKTKNSTDTYNLHTRLSRLTGNDFDFNFDGELIFPTPDFQMVDDQYLPEGGVFNGENEKLKLSKNELIVLSKDDTQSKTPKSHLLIGNEEFMDWLNSFTNNFTDPALREHTMAQMALLAFMASIDLSTLPGLKKLLE